MSHGNAVVINGKVYYGGGLANDADADDDNNVENNIYCYDPSQDKCRTTLPPLLSEGLVWVKSLATW